MLFWSTPPNTPCLPQNKIGSYSTDLGRATPNRFPVSRPGNGLLMQAGGRLLLLFATENLQFNMYFSEVEHPHNMQ